jgi:putative aldouronate transport system substrate-binding protein
MKKVWMILLSMLLVLQLCSGCGQTAQESVAESTDTSTTEPAAVSESQAPAEEAEPAQSQPAQEAAPAEAAEPEPEPEEPASIYPLTGDDLTITMWTAFQTQTGMVEGYADWPVVQQLFSNTGVTVDFHQVAQNAAGEQFNLMIVSGDWYDIIRNLPQYYSGGVATAYEEDVILDLTDLVDTVMPNYTAALALEDGNRVNISNDDGRLLFISKVQDEVLSDTGMTVRQDWMDALGLEDPETVDQLKDVLVAFQTEYGASSPIMVSSGSYGTLLANVFGVAGYDPDSPSSILYQVDGQVQCGIIQDAYREYLTTMRDWYAEGLFSKDFMSITSNPKDPTSGEMIANNQVGVWSAPTKAWDGYLSSATDPDMRLGAIGTILKDADSLDHFADTSSAVSTNGAWCISTTAADPVLCAQFIDYMFTEEGYYLLNYGIEGESYEMENGEPVWNTAYLQQLADEHGIGINTVAQGYYGIIGDMMGVQCMRQLFPFYDADTLDAITTWSDHTKVGDSYYLPTGFMSLTTEESAEAAQLLADITTYCSEHIAKFITGDEDIDAMWDTYVSTLQSMDLDRVIEIYQASYERYLSR